MPIIVNQNKNSFFFKARCDRCKKSVDIRGKDRLFIHQMIEYLADCDFHIDKDITGFRVLCNECEDSDDTEISNRTYPTLPEPDPPDKSGGLPVKYQPSCGLCHRTAENICYICNVSVCLAHSVYTIVPLPEDSKLNLPFIPGHLCKYCYTTFYGSSQPVWQPSPFTRITTYFNQ